MGGLESLSRALVSVVEPMTGIALWLLAAIFLWSGLAKLKRPHLAALTLIDFGATRTFDVRHGIALASVEVLVAVALVAPPSRLWAVGVSTVLLWFFTAAIALNLSRNRRFSCFCFGDPNDHLSGRTFARSISLALLASYLLFSPGPDEWAVSEAVLQISAVVSLLLSVRLIAALAFLRPRHEHGGRRAQPAGGM